MTKPQTTHTLRKWLVWVGCLFLWLGLMGAKSGRAGCMGYSYQECKPGETQACFSGFVFNRGVGECKDGNQTCQDDGTWGTCSGDVLPQEKDDCSGKDLNCDGIASSSSVKETCNGLDDDCDGTVDNGTDLCEAGKTCQGKDGCRAPAN